MDKLAVTEGLLFTSLFADGNRTIRGFEGVFSSFPPLPGDSILARDRTENVESIARVLKRDGYQTLFVYGGRGSFDYITSYTLTNGWDRLVEQQDFENPVHTTAWGVSDEDLFNRGIEEMRAMHSSGAPFLISFMTVSNHLPFTYPTGRIAEDPNAKSRKHAVKYADWALGDFFEKARKEPFWSDTIFVVVADHGARVYGSQSIPMKSYEIPLLIVGPAVVAEPKRIDVTGCQLDVAPTVLGLIGRPYASLFFGHDLLQPGADQRSRCLMHHNRSIAIYRDGMQVVFGLNKTVEYWQGDLYIAGYKDKRILNCGPYSMCRHPLYFFSFVGAVGIACASLTLTLPLLVGIGFVLGYQSIMTAEENFLTKKFGMAYTDYCASVPRLFPDPAKVVHAGKWETNPLIFFRHLGSVIWFVPILGMVMVVRHLVQAADLPVWLLLP
jgi:hypothetical protein